VPVLIEPGFDELQVGDLEGAPIEAYRSWRDQHAASDRLPHGESVQDALQALRGRAAAPAGEGGAGHACRCARTRAAVHHHSRLYRVATSSRDGPEERGSVSLRRARRPARRGQPGRVDLVRLRPLKSHRGNADSGPRAWTGSWTGSPDNPSAASAVSAMTRDIGSASASGAREHAPRNA
jgi:hypothetical protein